MCHLQAHAHEGEDHAPGQVDALHGDVEEGEGEHDHHQAEVHVFERILELARLFEHFPSHLPMHQVIISMTVSSLKNSEVAALTVATDMQTNIEMANKGRRIFKSSLSTCYKIMINKIQ